VPVPGGQGGKFQKRRPGVEQPFDPLAGQELAALAVDRHGGLGSPAADLGQALAQPLGEGAMVAFVGLELGGRAVHAGAQDVHGSSLLLAAPRGNEPPVRATSPYPLRAAWGRRRPISSRRY
jgi:hypothetical protein